MQQTLRLRQDVLMDDVKRFGWTKACVLLVIVAGSAACMDIINGDPAAEGCTFDTDCAANEICTASGDCSAVGDEPDGPTPEGPTPEGPTPEGPTPETAEPQTPSPAAEPEEPEPQVPSPAAEPGEPEPQTPEPSGEPADAGTVVDAGGEDAGRQDGGAEPDANPEPEPECESDGDCANGLTCLDDTCVVGCDGVPTAGTCTPSEFAYCANPGQPTEEIRTLSLSEPVCFNDLLMQSCGPTGQPEGIDCVSVGGDCSQGACIALPEGAICNDETLVCGSDGTGAALVCAGKDAQGEGTCQSGCGDLDVFGECADGVVTFCADEGLSTERIESYNCFDYEVCGTLRPGIDGCVVAQGQGGVCWNVGQNLGSCGSPQGNLACQIDLDTGNGQCVVNAANCDPAERRCTNNNLLMTSCYQNQPLLIWCGDHGGTCVDDVTPDGAACLNIQFQEVCNNDDLFCANGLQCVNGRCF